MALSYRIMRQEHVSQRKSSGDTIALTGDASSPRC